MVVIMVCVCVCVFLCNINHDTLSIALPALVASLCYDISQYTYICHHVCLSQGFLDTHNDNDCIKVPLSELVADTG